MVSKSSNGLGDIWKDNGCFCHFQKTNYNYFWISQHFLTLNCFKSILKTSGIFNYLCNEMIFEFLTEPSLFHIQCCYSFWNMKHRWLCQKHKMETIDNELLETIDNELCKLPSWVCQARPEAWHTAATAYNTHSFSWYPVVDTPL